jgi:plastocyanin
MKKMLTTGFAALLVLAGQPAQAATSTIQVVEFAYNPATVSIRQNDAVKWMFDSTTEDHTATSKGGLNLFDSGTVPPGGPAYTFLFKAAGSYPFFCQFHPSAMKGTVNVAIKVNPRTGGVATHFTVTWAAAAITGYRFDVQYQYPGSGGHWFDWKPNQTALSGDFVPDHGTGTYQFRSRLRKASNAKTSDYSAGKTITVS